MVHESNSVKLLSGRLCEPSKVTSSGTRPEVGSAWSTATPASSATKMSTEAESEQVRASQLAAVTVRVAV